VSSEDDERFERWIAPELPWLVAYLASLTGSRSEAEELAQETLVKALQAMERFDPAKTRDGSAAGWLRTIARNCWRNAARSKRRQRLEDRDLAAIEDFYHGLDAIDEQRRRALRICFETLPAGLAGVCRAHYQDEEPQATVAERFGLTAEALRKRLQRARSALRDCIGRRLADGEEQP